MREVDIAGVGSREGPERCAGGGKPREEVSFEIGEWSKPGLFEGQVPCELVGG